MKDDEGFIDATEQFEDALEKSRHVKFHLRLYIAGGTTRSAIALEKIREVCESNLKDRYTLEVIDIYQQPELARESQIIAAPTLIKSLPLPLRRIIGDLSSVERILVGLNLQTIDDYSDDEVRNDDRE